MTNQTVLAGLLVAACSVYAVWSLMPSGWRRRVAVWRGRPLPAGAGACGGCGGCAGTPATSVAPESRQAPEGTRVIHIVRQPRKESGRGRA